MWSLCSQQNLTLNYYAIVFFFKEIKKKYYCIISLLILIITLKQKFGSKIEKTNNS